jgi:uncharacterized GH25 family protein
MPRFLLTLLAAALMSAGAFAHFVFIIPHNEGASVQVVFSDTLEPDENVDIAKIAGLTLTGRFADGKHAPVPCKKGHHCLVAELGLVDPRVVFGSLDYGVIQRGENKPYLLKYHPKAVLPGTDEKMATLGEKAAVELVPVLTREGLHLKFLAAGRPVPEAEVTVLKPDGTKEKVLTDKDGRTKPFSKTGRYGAWARYTEAKSGEHHGKKYEEVRHYATLVVETQR